MLPLYRLSYCKSPSSPTRIFKLPNDTVSDNQKAAVRVNSTRMKSLSESVFTERLFMTQTQDRKTRQGNVKQMV